MELRTRFLPKLLNSEVDEYLKSNDIIIVPVGTVEMHGGLPLDSETVISEAFALKMAEACDGLVLTGLPYFYAGATASGRGTVQVSVRQGIDYLSAIAHSLLRQGFKRQVYISFHGPAHMTCSPMVRDFFDETGVPILYIDLSMQMFKSAKDLFKSMDAFHAITVGAYQLLSERLRGVLLRRPHGPHAHHRHSRRGHAQSSGRRRSGADWRDREAHGYAARRRADAGPESIYGPRRGTVPLDAQRIQQRQMTHRSPAP